LTLAIIAISCVERGKLVIVVESLLGWVHNCVGLDFVSRKNKLCGIVCRSKAADHVVKSLFLSETVYGEIGASNAFQMVRK